MNVSSAKHSCVAPAYTKVHTKRNSRSLLDLGKNGHVEQLKEDNNDHIVEEFAM